MIIFKIAKYWILARYWRWRASVYEKRLARNQRHRLLCHMCWKPGPPAMTEQGATQAAILAGWQYWNGMPYHRDCLPNDTLFPAPIFFGAQEARMPIVWASRN